MTVLADLQKWYASNCDGEWEHEYGIIVETMDNPGWSVTIHLNETNLEGKDFQSITEAPSDGSWLECRVEGLKFVGFCDPSRLEEVLRVFVDWAKSQNADWLKPPPPLSDEELLTLQDEEFFASLDGEVESETCRRDGCTRKRILKISGLCREHHFEMVTGRAAPQTKN